MTSTTMRRFTGTHLVMIVVAFFAIVIGVNVTMATLASRTFGGAIVRNGYVANQDFDEGLAAGERQAALGWRVTARIEGPLLVVEAYRRDGRPLDVAGTVTLSHPIGPVKAHELVLHRRPDGTLAVPHGRSRGQWDALIRLNADGGHYRLERRLIIEG